MSEIPLNKFEKRDLILRLLKEGKIYREICHIAHVCPREIKPIAKEYERKKRLENKKGKENNQSGPIKKLSLSSRAFKLFIDGKKPTEVVIELDIPPEKVEKLWSQFLKSERMEECYDFFKMCQYNIPTFLTIDNFMKRNNISGPDIANVLRKANSVINLNQIISNLKVEIEKLKQNKNNQQYPQNNFYYPLKPLPKMNWNYPYRNNYW